MLLCFGLCLTLFAGCSLDTEEPYIPTGDGLTWDEGYPGPANQQEEEFSTQELTLAYYPDVTMNPYLCTDFTNKALHTLL
jgi:hypothetical protein